MCREGEYFGDENGGAEQQTCFKCPDNTYQDSLSHRQIECIDQPLCKTGEVISQYSAERLQTCSQCPDWFFQPKQSHRDTKCRVASVTTCNNAGNFNPASGECDCYKGYGGDDCSDVAAGCMLGNNAMQSKLDEAARKNVQNAIPPIAAISGASVFCGYVYLLNGGDPKKATSFFKLSWRAHAWAVMSVGMKTFDLLTDIAFFFLSLRGEPFESQFMVAKVVANDIGNQTGNETSTNAVGRRFTNEGRYDSNVVAIQLTAFASITLGTLFTFGDMYGTRQRLSNHVNAATKITIAVLTFEDVPQLIITVVYMLTVSKGASTASLNEIDPDASAVLDFLEGIDTISIVSLLASVASLMYSVYLLISDRRVAAAQQREQDEEEAQVEARPQGQQQDAAPGPSPNQRPYKPSDSTFTNPAFNKSAQPVSAKQDKKANGIERCNVRSNTADMARPVERIDQVDTGGSAGEKSSSSQSKPKTQARAQMANVSGFAVDDVGKACTVPGVGSGIIRFVGLHAEKQEPRIGVEMNEPKGKNNGTVNGHKYFECKEGHGLLTTLKKVVVKNSGAGRGAARSNMEREAEIMGVVEDVDVLDLDKYLEVDGADASVGSNA